MSKSAPKSLISIVVPVYNEEAGLKAFFKLLSSETAALSKSYTFEYVFVNDGSRDESYSILSGIAQTDKSIKVVNLSRNFGKEIATSAGIAKASGDAVILMDADGQHPPKLINQFLKLWRTGSQVVVGVRKSNQKEGLVKKWGSKMFYRLFNSSSSAKLVPGATDFCLIDRAVQAEFIKLKEHNRITRGLIDWLGFKKSYIEFEAPARLAGEATYNIRKLVKLATDSFISLSLGPLYLAAYAGLVLTPLSFVLGIFIFIEQVIMRDPLGLNFTGSAMLGILLVFLVGILLISQGLLGMYISHLHTQALGRPLFVIDYSTSVGIQQETHES